MVKKNKILIGAIVLILALIAFNRINAWILISDEELDINESAIEETPNVDEVFGSIGIESTGNYYATATTDEVITTNAAVLHRIIIGETKPGVLQISNHETSANGNITWYTSGTDLQGVWDVGIYFNDGIVFTTTNQANVTFVWDPR